MLTDFRRQDLDRMLTSKDVKAKLTAEGADRDAVYPQTLGWVESQAERAREIAREALDEVDRLKAQLEAAERHVSDEDTGYWDEFYPEEECTEDSCLAGCDGSCS